MQLSFSFSFLLTTLLFALTQVKAHLTKRTPGLVTLPLRRVVQESDDHPSVRLQRNINHAHRRHALMTGREGPSNAELAKRIEKRFNLARPPTGGETYKPASSKRAEGGSSPEKAGTGKADPKDGFPKAALDALGNNVTKAKGPTANNSLGLDVLGNDVVYLATVQIGTPPRNFSVVVDSGSADFWVGGEDCKSEKGSDCGAHTFLGNSSSSTFNDTGTAWSIRYGAGFVNGTIVTDDVKIAGLALNKHQFGVAHIEATIFSDDNFDGILGTAGSSLSEQGGPTLIECLVKNGLISEAITSYKISRFSDGLNDGQVTFGGLDKSKFHPNTLVTFKSINERGFWEGSVNISVGGKDIGLQNRTAIFDTGSATIIAPEDDARTLHTAIPGAESINDGGYTIPCNNTAVVSLTFGGRTFDINPIDLLFIPVDRNDPKGRCYSSISSTLVFGGPKQWLVGDVFLKNVYFSHDVGKNEISLAELV